jgi:hypothetical protein
MSQPLKAAPEPQGGLVQVTERNCSNVSIFFTPKETKPFFSLMKKDLPVMLSTQSSENQSN